MAERWQQWMPFHIDRFRGSPDVQAMHPAARCGFLYLLASAWQTEDCSLSADAIDLATASGLGDELWAVHGPRILRKFALTESGRYVNEVLTNEWNAAHRKYLINQERANATNEKRKANAARSSDVTKQDETRTHLQEHKQLHEQKELKAIAQSDQRLEIIYTAYPRHVGKAKALQAIRSAVIRLSDNGMSVPDAMTHLRCRAETFARSPAGQAGEFTPHPATWFNQERYLDDDKEWQRNGQQKRNFTPQPGKTASSIDAAQQAINELARQARVAEEDSRNSSTFGEAGNPPPNEAGHGRLLGHG